MDIKCTIENRIENKLFYIVYIVTEFSSPGTLFIMWFKLDY